jgi:hypothetical protein
MSQLDSGSGSRGFETRIKLSLEWGPIDFFVEVCTGRNFRIVPGPARGTFGPTQPETDK